MEYNYLENILEELPVIPLDSIVSHTIANDEYVKIILFGFAAGWSSQNIHHRWQFWTTVW
jgi:hypothetical protein